MIKSLLSLLILIPSLIFSQSNEDFYINGNIKVDNNGVDWIPLYTLGEPALSGSFSIGNDRFSINPNFRYELDGLQPWAVDIIWNYKLKNKGKFNIDIGAFFPGASFQRIEVDEEKLPDIIIQPWVTTLTTTKLTYRFNDSFGLSFLYYEGFNLKKVNDDQFDGGRMFFLQPEIKQFNLTNKIKINWLPQLYTIHISADKSYYGFLAASTLQIGFKDFPLSIVNIVNQSIDFGNLTGKKFDYSFGINYFFELNFIKK
ncbi:MAG: hypothetical protein EVA41_03880 [Flavobacteriales bacterium]|nr:MAG: hypothetical protein EVA41_03880 [Flavobacteriales bacterium]CAI8350388.1 MAG: Uncharacterised protein [Flavobacteriales bacterium]|tara:strand:- start:21 stop:791 length:771 start_codon:yes stop_codon:yes gene_type:complete